jgi:hypothetical protein
MAPQRSEKASLGRILRGKKPWILSFFARAKKVTRPGGRNRIIRKAQQLDAVRSLLKANYQS